MIPKMRFRMELSPLKKNTIELRVVMKNIPGNDIFLFNLFTIGIPIM